MIDLLYYAKFLHHKVKNAKMVQIEYSRQLAEQSTAIKLFNWWRNGCYDWFVRRYAKLVDETDAELAFCSLFGSKDVISHVSIPKVFFSGENVHWTPYNNFSDYCLDTVDLGLGYDYFEMDKYIRFPLWIMYIFDPCSDETDIRERCKTLRYPEIGERTRFCSLVASHDPNNLRKEMLEQLENIGHVDCPGLYLHNDDSLKRDFNDDKVKYLREFMFNICPENTNSQGYVTEKLFESILSGVVPIYWGSYNNPEPDILNKDAILFWDRKAKNEPTLSLISDMLENRQMFNDFIHQPRLVNTAEDVVVSMIMSLDRKIKDILA